jgi:hypothetical protein
MEGSPSFSTEYSGDVPGSGGNFFEKYELTFFFE